jgi:nicotinate-nucleotide--dimethylbenzimidazole phosphoribosyltransferase
MPSTLPRSTIACLPAYRRSRPTRAAGLLRLRPLLDMGISHGEGAGAALAAGLVKAAALTCSGMAAATR